MSRLALPAELSIAHLEDLRAELSVALSAGATLELDGGAVTRIDTAALQLLCAFVSAGGRLRWQATTPPLLNAARLLALAPHLGLASEPS